MAYQAKRHKKFTEDFELVEEDGNVAHTIHVSLDADDMTVNISRKYTALTKAMAESDRIKKATDDRKDIDALQNCIEKLGRAIVDLLEAVFGTENANIIIKFYEGRYMEMSQEVLPFISTVVIPRMIELKADHRKSVMQKYNRKQRRTLFKRME